MRNLHQYFWIALLLPSIALAHPGHDSGGFGAGLGHPLTGMDHLLVMLAMGWWAASNRVRYWLWLPLSFAGSMLASVALPVSIVAALASEVAVASTLVVVGLLLLARAQWALLPSILLAGICGAAHGLVHALEIPAHGSALGWLAGMVLATLSVLIAGAMFARHLSDWTRAAGLGVACAGIALVIA